MSTKWLFVLWGADPDEDGALKVVFTSVICVEFTHKVVVCVHTVIVCAVVVCAQKVVVCVLGGGPC